MRQFYSCCFDLLQNTLQPTHVFFPIKVPCQSIMRVAKGFRILTVTQNNCLHPLNEMFCSMTTVWLSLTIAKVCGLVTPVHVWFPSCIIIQGSSIFSTFPRAYKSYTGGRVRVRHMLLKNDNTHEHHRFYEEDS